MPSSQIDMGNVFAEEIDNNIKLVYLCGEIGVARYLDVRSKCHWEVVGRVGPALVVKLLV